MKKNRSNLIVNDTSKNRAGSAPKPRDAEGSTLANLKQIVKDKGMGIKLLPNVLEFKIKLKEMD